MNPVGVGQTDTLNGAGSTDVGGTITDYKWDLNGDGTYETDTGSTPTVTTQIRDRRHGDRRPAGHRQQRRNSHSTTLSVRVIAQGVSRYADAVTSAPGLLHYYTPRRA